MNLRRNVYNTEYDSEGNIVDKPLFIKLMLNRAAETTVPNFSSVTKPTNIIVRGMSNDGQSIGEPVQLDLEDHLLLCVSQPHRPVKAALKKFIHSHKMLEITDDTRRAFIMLFTEAYLQKLSNPNYYQLIVDQIPNYPPNYFIAIEKDINRTFSKESDLHPQLRNVLCAYAIRNPRLLYCQGLNYIVAYFLINGYTECQTFWVLTQLVEVILPLDYYVDMGAVICLSRILDDLMEEFIPKFKNSCQELNLQTSFFLVPWLVCLYTKGFCSSLSNFIMECLVIDREVALIKTALSLLKLVESKVVTCQDFSEMMKQIELIVVSISVKSFKSIYDSIYINSYLFKVLFDSYVRDYEKNAETKEIDSVKKNRNLLPKCSKDLPVCLHVIQISRRFRIISQVDTFRIKKDLGSLIQYGYMDSGSSPVLTALEKQKRLFKESIDQLLIGRHEHICERPTSKRYELSSQDIISVLKLVTEDEPSEAIELEQFVEKKLRRTNTQKLDSMSTLFEIVEDFDLIDTNIVEQVVEEKKEIEKETSNNKILRMPSASKADAVINWFKKIF